MIFNILLVITLIICCITDLRVRKIYNKVIFPVLFCVFILQLILNGIPGLTISLLGFLSGLLILIIPFALRGIGAGDVKLLALIGAIKGSTFAFNTAIYMFVIGGVIAMIIVLFHRETIKFFKSLIYFFAGLFMRRAYKLIIPTTPLVKKFPYSSAIAGGAIISLLIKGAAIL